MATSDADLWHQVHAQREDGVAAMFLIREVEPRPDQPQIFVIEMPYPITEISKLPDAAGYRRLDTFQEQWIEPACEALDWTFVAWKSEDGSFFLYLYGAGDPNALLERLAPFDGALGFFNDRDADWSEYAALRELVDQAQAADEDEDAGEAGHVHTEDCEHEHDGEATSHGISVIDLTGERPAGKAKAKAAKTKTAKAKPAKPAARAQAAKAKPTKPASAKAKPAKAKPAKATSAKSSSAKSSSAKAKPAKPTSTKSPSAKAKPTKTTSASAKAPSKAAATKVKRANTKQPARGKPAARPMAKAATTTKPAKAKPAAKKSATRKR